MAAIHLCPIPERNPCDLLDLPGLELVHQGQITEIKDGSSQSLLDLKKHRKESRNQEAKSDTSILDHQITCLDCKQGLFKFFYLSTYMSCMYLLLTLTMY